MGEAQEDREPNRLIVIKRSTTERLDTALLRVFFSICGILMFFPFRVWGVFVPPKRPPG